MLLNSGNKCHHSQKPDIHMQLGHWYNPKDRHKMMWNITKDLEIEHEISIFIFIDVGVLIYNNVNLQIFAVPNCLTMKDSSTLISTKLLECYWRNLVFGRNIYVCAMHIIYNIKNFKA